MILRRVQARLGSLDCNSFLRVWIQYAYTDARFYYCVTPEMNITNRKYDVKPIGIHKDIAQRTIWLIPKTTLADLMELRHEID